MASVYYKPEAAGKKALVAFAKSVFPDFSNDGRFASGIVYGLSSENSMELARRFLSCLCAGGIPLPLPPNHHLIRRAGFEFPWPDPVPRIPDEADYACLTSGSTGKPRILFFNLDRAFLNAKMHADSLDINADSVLIQSLPLHHSFGLVAYLFTAAVMQCELVFSNAPFDWLEIPRSRAVLHLTPDHLSRLAKHRLDWPEDMTVSVGAGRVRALDMNSMARVVKNLHVTYGLSEAGPRVATGRWLTDSLDGYIGRTFPALKFRIEKSVDLSQAGELLVRTPCMAVGVAADRLSSDGFLHTGDLVKSSDNGDLVYLGRKDEDVKWRGQTYPIAQIRQKAQQRTVDKEAVLFFPDDPSDKLVLYVTEEIEIAYWAGVFAEFSLSAPNIVVVECFRRDSMGKIVIEGFAGQRARAVFVI